MFVRKKKQHYIDYLITVMTIHLVNVRVQFALHQAPRSCSRSFPLLPTAVDGPFEVI